MVRADVPTDDREGPAEEFPSVSVARTTPERAVFSEADNPDGWIATDTTVDLDR